MKLLVTLFFALFPLFAMSNDTSPEVVPMAIKTAYIPRGFDSNDNIQIVVEGYLPNTCYRVGPHSFRLDSRSKTVSLQQYAYKYKGLCLMMTVPFTQVIELGLAETGQYKVVDLHYDTTLGNLPVKVATTTQADEYLYAPVENLEVDIKNLSLEISGHFTNSCMRLRETKVDLESHNVVVVLPVAESVDSSGCKEGDFPFSGKVSLPILTEGRYLIHVRSLNGQAVNKLVNIFRRPLDL